MTYHFGVNNQQMQYRVTISVLGVQVGPFS